MRKQTKLVAVLSAAALLAMGASMTSFAAGWEKDDAGIWHYYDKDDEMVTGEWKKDGGKWFYLDDDGEMLTDSWVDDEYYVGEDGAMLINQWIKTTAEDEVDDPDSDGDYWYYFGSKGKKVTDDSKKINGKTYYFDVDGKMEYGWYEKDGDIFYLGGEDEGARTDNMWLWLEKPSNEDEDHDDAANYLGCVDDNTDPCDDEGWYWFGSNGKMTRDNDKKKINGRYYFFNEHGQMLYEWINDRKVSGVAPASQSNPALDGSASPSGINQVSHMVYANEVEEGWRADGWYEIDGSEDTKTDSDTDWYFFKDGKAKKADMAKDTAGIRNDDGTVYVARIKVDSPKGGKAYFAFNEYGQMQTGLQYIAKDKGFYYFDENGYPKSGKVSNVECDDDSYEFYFNTTKGKNGQGYTDGEKSGYLYFNGKKLTADDDYRLFFWNDKIYLVNTKGKIQKNNKKYDIENNSIDEDKVWVNFNSDDSVKEIILDEGKGTKYSSAQLLANSLVADSSNHNEYVDADGKYEDKYVTIPFIQLYDDDVYTYHFTPRTVNSDGVQTYTSGEKWYDVHVTTNNWK